MRTDITRLFAILRTRLRTLCSVSDLTENTRCLGYVRKEQPGRVFAIKRVFSCLSNFNQLWGCYRQILVKLSNVKFHEISRR
jgi:hypothetical protein